MIIIREDLAEKGGANLPAYLRYKTHGDKDSLYNTPPGLLHLRGQQGPEMAEG